MDQGLPKGLSPPNPKSLRVGRGGYLSDEDSSNFLVIPAEGGEELMVSSGETVLITRAAWMDMGRAMRAPRHLNHLNAAPSGHLSRVDFCQSGSQDWACLSL